MLVCNPDSQLANYAHGRKNVCALVMPQGSNDQSFAMTSSFSCMMLSTALLLGPYSLDAAQQPLAQMIERCRELRETLQSQVKPWPAVALAVTSCSAVAVSPAWRRKPR